MNSNDIKTIKPIYSADYGVTEYKITRLDGTTYTLSAAGLIAAIKMMNSIDRINWTS